MVSGGDRLASVAGKETVAIVDPWAAAAGADSKQALQSLGVWEKVSAKSIGVVGTADAAFLLSQGKARLAIVYATDVAANPAGQAAQLGLNFSAKLQFAGIWSADCPFWPRERGVFRFGSRQLRPAPNSTPGKPNAYPPAVAQPGSVGGPGYSPLMKF